MLRAVVLFLVAVGSVSPAFAQPDSIGAPARGASLTGRVTDPTGKPLEGVSVGITELRRGTLTDAEGRYTIHALPLGVYRVSFQRLSSTPVVRRIALSAGSVTLDVTLTDSALELPGTQVTATANPTTALTSPQPTSVLEGEALRRAQAPTLGGTLEQLPGLRSWSTGSGVGKPTIRGLRSDRVVIAEEGLRVENQNWGDEHGPQIESADIDRVEVVRGPASVLYGSDALGGVVNVIPRVLPTAFGRSPFVGGRVYGGFGSVDRNGEAGLSLEGASQGLGFRASFTGRKSEDVRTPEGELFNSGNQAMTGSGAIGVRGARGSLDVSYAHRFEDVEIHEDPAEDPTATGHQKIVDDLGRLAAVVPIGEKSRLAVNLGAEQNRRREFESDGDPTVALGLLARNYVGLVRFYHPQVGALEGLIGASFNANRFDKFGEESLIPDSRAINGAVFAFEQVEADPWRFAFGVRYDRRTLKVEEDDPDLGVPAQERTWDAVTGNVGVLYRVAEPVALVANVGRGFRAPSNFDLFSNGVHEGTVAFEQGNPALEVETSINGDLAVRVQSSRVRAEVGAFINEIRDYIYTRPTGTFDPASGFEIFETVQGNARLVGFEASLEGHPNRHVHLSASSDFVRGDNTETDTPLPWIPPLRATYGVRFEPDPIGKIEDAYIGIRGESIARQTRLDPFDTVVPAYTLAHAEAGLAIPIGERSITLDLAVRNLFDRAYRDFMSRFKTYALAPGRNVTVRLSTQF
jgi:iron complex outermembrane recepter protein